MSSQHQLAASPSPTRFAFRLASGTIRAVIPRGAAGVYLLLKDGAPLYVGRSDLCVRERLATHALAGTATHFVWEPCEDPDRAFVLESFWFHRLRDLPAVLNAVHPASPKGSEVHCPFCDDGDVAALAYALGLKTVQDVIGHSGYAPATHPHVPVDETTRGRRQRRK